MSGLEIYADADGYDVYMGRWSAALAPPFLSFAELDRPTRILDVGCGTGKLLEAARERFPAAALVGADPSVPLLDKARAVAALAGANLVEASADNLPFADDAFDGCLSLLVLQEFSGLAELIEMRRVTSRGAVVAACQWDFSRMPVIAALIDGIASANPSAAATLKDGSPDIYDSQEDLHAAWKAAGFSDISTRRIRVSRRYPSFGQMWNSVLAGTTPSTVRLKVLSDAEREVVAGHMRRALFGPDGEAVDITAEALAVRGFA